VSKIIGKKSAGKIAQRKNIKLPRMELTQNDIPDHSDYK